MLDKPTNQTITEIVGSTNADLVPLLKRFEDVDPMTYSDIALALFEAYRAGMRSNG